MGVQELYVQEGIKIGERRVREEARQEVRQARQEVRTALQEVRRTKVAVIKWLLNEEQMDVAKIANRLQVGEAFVRKVKKSI